MAKYVWGQHFKEGRYLSQVKRVEDSQIGTLSVIDIQSDKTLIEGGVVLYFDETVAPPDRDIQSWTAMSEYVIENLA